MVAGQLAASYARECSRQSSSCTSTLPLEAASFTGCLPCNEPRLMYAAYPPLSTHPCSLCEPTLNPSFERQAIGRSHRMGQDRPLTVTRLLMMGGWAQRWALAMPGKGPSHPHLTGWWCVTVIKPPVPFLLLMK